MSDEDCRNRFHGFARVPFNLIYRDGMTIPQYFANMAPGEAKQASVLARDFDLRGCQRANHHNFVDVLINAVDFPIESLTCQLPPSVDHIPLLKEPVRCLHGLHRLLAACQIIHEEESRWWIARVYSQGLDDNHQAVVSDQFSNESPGLDGIIFRNIRMYHRRHDTEGENRWWARLTERKRQDLKQLLKDERYSDQFDAMTEWPGLWHPIRLGCLHRLLTMKCDEYLNHIVQTWKEILFGAQEDGDLVDESTVLNLETLVPGSSSEDGDKARELMESGKIFSKVKTQHDRQVILQNLLSVQGLIPSLYTFLESLKFLEPCAKIMRRITPMKGHGSIREGLWSAFRRPVRMTVEYAENDVREHEGDSASIERQIGYQQLWLFTMRNFERMCNTTTRKNKKQPKPLAREPNPSTLAAFGRLACRLGFETKGAKTLRDLDDNTEWAKQIAHHGAFAQRPDLVDAIVHVLKRRPLRREPVTELKLSSFRVLSKNLRCGRPYASDHIIDSPGLFLPAILRPLPTDLFSNVTTFFCKRDMFLRFFGTSMVGTLFNAPMSLPTSPEPNLEENDVPTSSDQSEVHERLKTISTENQELRADLRDAREETFHINAAFVLEKQALQNKLVDEQARSQKLETELYSFRQNSSSSFHPTQGIQSPGKEARWTEGLCHIDSAKKSDLSDAKIAGDLILIMLGSGTSYRVSDEQADMVLEEIAGGYRYYVADYGALQNGFEGLNGFKALAPHTEGKAHISELWRRLRVLAVHEDTEPAWVGVTSAKVGEMRRIPRASARKTETRSYAGVKKRYATSSPPLKRVAQEIGVSEKESGKGRPARLFRNRNLFQPSPRTGQDRLSVLARAEL